MDDDIANAINSLASSTTDSDAVPSVSDKVSVGDTQDSPPITRPEDVGTEPEIKTSLAEMSAETTSNQATESIVDLSPVEPIQPEPVDMGQTFAPMPQLVTEESIAPIAKEPTRVDPAMVADPLYPSSKPAPPRQIAVDGSEIPKPAVSSVVAKPVRPKATNKTLKNILIYGGITVAVVGVVVGGFFAYKAYAKQKSFAILSNAMTAALGETGVSWGLVLSNDNDDVEISYDVDMNGNIRTLVDGGKYQYSLVKLKNKDSVYVGDSTMLRANMIRTFVEYKNFSKTVALLAADGVDIAKINNIPKLFTADSQRYITIEPEENIDGLPQYKYTYSPTKEMITAFGASLTGGDEEAALLPFPESFDIIIWVDRATGRISKLSGVSKGSELDIQSMGNDPEGFVTQSAYSVYSGLDFSFTITAKYDFTETVKLPIGSKITQSMDLAKLYSDIFHATTETQNPVLQ